MFIPAIVNSTWEWNNGVNRVLEAMWL